MWVTFFIAAGFFVAIVAMGYFAVQQGDGEGETAGAAAAAAPAGTLGSCLLCDGSLGTRPATSDEVVFEVEHRIDTELRDITHALRSHPESLGRLFHS